MAVFPPMVLIYTDKYVFANAPREYGKYGCLRSCTERYGERNFTTACALAQNDLPRRLLAKITANAGARTVSKQPLASAARTRSVRGGRRRARRGRARLSPSRRGGSGTKSRVHPSSKAARSMAAASLRWSLTAGRLNVENCISACVSRRHRKRGCGEKRRGFSPRGAKRPRGRFSTGNRRGEARRLPRRKAPIPPLAFTANIRMSHALPRGAGASSPRYPGFANVITRDCPCVRAALAIQLRSRQFRHRVKGWVQAVRVAG